MRRNGVGAREVRSECNITACKVGSGTLGLIGAEDFGIILGSRLAGLHF